MTGVDVRYGEHSISQIGDRIEEIMKKYYPENSQMVAEVVDELLGAVTESFNLKAVDLKLKDLFIVSDNTPQGTVLLLGGEEKKKISNIRSMRWSIDAHQHGSLMVELV